MGFFLSLLAYPCIYYILSYLKSIYFAAETCIYHQCSDIYFTMSCYPHWSRTQMLSKLVVAVYLILLFQLQKLCNIQ